MNNLINRTLVLAMAGATAYTGAVSAATFVGEGTAAGKQCVSLAVNNSGVVVGTCTPGTTSGPSVAWVASTAGTEVPLPPLVSGQGCTAVAIDNNGQIAGSCKMADNRATAVIWNSATPGAAPVALQAVSVLGTGLLPEARTVISAFNQSDVLAGASLSGTGDATAVLWFSGSTAPLQVSALHDNCFPADINNTPINGVPTVALDCPNPASGNTVAKVVQKTGLLGTLVTTPLTTPAGSTGCSVSSVNNAVQLLGTCHFSAPDVPQAVYWPNPSATPVQLSSISGVSGASRITGLRLNNNGHAVVSYQDSNGHHLLAFWTPSSGSTQLIPPLAGGTHIGFVDLSDNDVVALTSENAGEHHQAATWTSATGTVAVPQFGGGQESGLTAISPNGTYVAGGAEDSTGTDDAVVATLP
jgi:hypothetical protein